MPIKEFCIINTSDHKEFLKNMLTGASYADLAVLMVSVEGRGMLNLTESSYLLNFLWKWKFLERKWNKQLALEIESSLF